MIRQYCCLLNVQLQGNSILPWVYIVSGIYFMDHCVYFKVLCVHVQMNVHVCMHVCVHTCCVFVLVHVHTHETE